MVPCFGLLLFNRPRKTPNSKLVLHPLCKKTYCGWTKYCTALKPRETMICWYLQGIIMPGFLRWCRISSIHSMYPYLPRPQSESIFLKPSFPTLKQRHAPAASSPVLRKQAPEARSLQQPSRHVETACTCTNLETSSRRLTHSHKNAALQVANQFHNTSKPAKIILANCRRRKKRFRFTIWPWVKTQIVPRVNIRFNPH